MEFFKENTKESEPCCCNCDCSDENMKKAEEKKAEKGIKILGSGCKKCNALEEAARQALAELSMNEEIDHVTDFGKIASYGVMSTPALVVDGKVVSFGKVLKKDEVVKILKEVRG